MENPKTPPAGTGKHHPRRIRQNRVAIRTRFAVRSPLRGVARGFAGITWPEYDAALVRRGSLTVWVTEEAIAAWHAPATGKRGGQPVYSDLAIQTGLALRLVLRLGLRQIEGTLGSIAHLLSVDISIPDHTTFSRRGDGLRLLTKPVKRGEPLHLLVDSTGLKMYGEAEWHEEKHGKRFRRRWRKLHLAMDANSHEIVAVELTTDDVGDVTVVPDLLDQIDGSVASMTADGAYDTEVVYDEVSRRHPDADVIIPPRSTAVASERGTTRSASPNDRKAWADWLATALWLLPTEPR